MKERTAVSVRDDSRGRGGCPNDTFEEGIAADDFDSSAISTVSNNADRPERLPEVG